MKKFEILEHRADLKIRAFGKTKEELFLNALLGMTAGLRPDYSCLPPGSKQDCLLPGGKHTRKIKVKSPDLNALLVDFLSEALYLIHVNKEIYSDVRFNDFSDNHLEAELIGQKVERLGEDIKAVTYHGLKIRQRNDGLFEAIVLFDI